MFDLLLIQLGVGKTDSDSNHSMPFWLSVTFDIGHLLATGLAVEAELVGHRILYLDIVGQEQNDLHLSIGQVSPTADALGSLDVWPAQQSHRGLLVHILRGEPAGNLFFKRHLSHCVK